MSEWNIESILSGLCLVFDHALDEGWPLPSTDQIGRVEELLKRLFAIKEHPYWIYPMPTGEVIVDAGNYDDRIIIHVKPDLSVIYTYLDSDGKLQAQKVEDSELLPDELMIYLLDNISVM